MKTNLIVVLIGRSIKVRMFGCVTKNVKLIKNEKRSHAVTCIYTNSIHLGGIHW